jgi:hypothetical protein
LRCHWPNSFLQFSLSQKQPNGVEADNLTLQSTGSFQFASVFEPFIVMVFHGEIMVIHGITIFPRKTMNTTTS